MALSVIAQFSKKRAGAYVTFYLLLSLYFLLAELANFIDSADFDQRFYRPLVLLGSFLAPFLLYQQIMILRQLIFRGAAAVWLESDKVHFLDFYWSFTFSAVSLVDIQRVAIAPERLFRSAAITLHLKGGAQKSLPTALLLESKAEVLARLSRLVHS